VPDEADQVDAALQEHPPRVGRHVLPPQLVTGGEHDLVADRDELADLVLAHLLEQGK